MAMNWEILKTRYLQTSRASQMDSLSLNLTRLQSLAASGVESSVAHHLVRESQFFIEWIVSGLKLGDRNVSSHRAAIPSASAQSVEAELDSAMEQRARTSEDIGYVTDLVRATSKSVECDR